MFQYIMWQRILEWFNENILGFFFRIWTQVNMITGLGSVGYLNLQNTIHVRKAHKHFVCVCTPKHTDTQCGLHFLEGSFQCGWRTADVANYTTDGKRERGGERKWDGERREEEREGRRSQLAINSSSCPSGSAEPRHEFPPESISGWQWRNCILSCHFFKISSMYSICPFFHPPIVPNCNLTSSPHLFSFTTVFPLVFNFFRFLYDSFPYLFHSTDKVCVCVCECVPVFLCVCVWGDYSVFLPTFFCDPSLTFLHISFMLHLFLLSGPPLNFT